MSLTYRWAAGSSRRLYTGSVLCSARRRTSTAPGTWPPPWWCCPRRRRTSSTGAWWCRWSSRWRPGAPGRIPKSADPSWPFCSPSPPPPPRSFDDHDPDKDTVRLLRRSNTRSLTDFTKVLLLLSGSLLLASFPGAYSSNGRWKGSKGSVIADLMKAPLWFS